MKNEASSARAARLRAANRLIHPEQPAPSSARATVPLKDIVRRMVKPRRIAVTIVQN